jgi:Carboxypeptidase regulatory-like domain
LFLVAFGVSGCGRNSPQSSASLPAPTKPIDPATTASITGKVTLDGPPPAARTIDMSAEPNCGKTTGAPAVSQQVVTDSSGNLANVVVFVKDFPADYIVPVPPASAATLVQRGCMYDPHVVALRAGQTLEISNADQTTHNLLALPEQNPKFNRSETPGAAPVDVVFAIPELAIPLRCNVHPWMKSYVFVFRHPYFAVTAADGSFEIKNLPPGTYSIQAWQELYGAREAQVTVGPKESKPLNFKFAASGAGN